MTTPTLRIVGRLIAINPDADPINPDDAVWSLLFNSQGGKPVVITGVLEDYAQQLLQLDRDQDHVFAITIGPAA